MKILIVDNYDSFTYNLVHLVEHICDTRPDVVRNDVIEMGSLMEYDKIILSPGPGLPVEAGKLLEVIKNYAAIKPLLGVCLGHQAIGEVFGGKLVNLETVYHGIASPVRILKRKNKDIFNGLRDSFDAGRYHSWVIRKEDFPGCLEILAEDEAGNIMAMKHKQYDVTGVQFHPESILTPDGEQIMRNWLQF